MQLNSRRKLRLSFGALSYFNFTTEAGKNQLLIAQASLCKLIHQEPLLFKIDHEPAGRLCGIKSWRRQGPQDRHHRVQSEAPDVHVAIRGNFSKHREQHQKQQLETPGFAEVLAYPQSNAIPDLVTTRPVLRDGAGVSLPDR